MKFWATLVAFLVVLSTAVAAETFSVAVEFGASGRSENPEEPPPLWVEATSTNGVNEVLKFEVDPAVGPRELSLELEAEKNWLLRAMSPGFWSAEAEVKPDLDSPVRLTLWPAATVTGRVRTPPEGAFPADVQVSLARPPAEEGVEKQPEKSEVTCSLKEGALGACALPAGRWNLRLKAANYVPHYLWNMNLRAGKAFSLGEISLEPGTSLVGRVITEEGPADPARTQVELRPVVNKSEASEAENRELETLSVSTGINELGYFQFEAVRQGVYQLTASLAGFASKTLSPVLLDRFSDIELSDPLVMERAIRLVVSVEPPYGLADANWEVVLFSNGGDEGLREIADGHTKRGIWTSPPVPAGPFMVAIQDGGESTVAIRQVDLAYDQQELPVELELVEVRGQVFLAEEPLAADLHFVGDLDERVMERADEDGEFHVTLPRTGKWRVDVFSEWPAMDVVGLEIDATPKLGSTVAHVRIDVPDTRLHGLTVDTLGNPVGGAKVRVADLAKPHRGSMVVSNADGSFELWGQRPGTYSVQGTAGEKQSAVVSVTLQENLDPAAIVLALEDLKRLSGIVESRSGPVPRALVTAVPITPLREIAANVSPEVRAGMDGSFELLLPPNTAAVQVVVQAPGYVLYSSRHVSSERSEPLVVSLETEGGTLRLGTKSSAESVKAGRVDVILADGLPLSLPILEGWAYINGARRDSDEETTIPLMPPGKYSFCTLAFDEALLVVSGAATPLSSSCAGGYLSAGGELALKRRDR